MLQQLLAPGHGSRWVVVVGLREEGIEQLESGPDVRRLDPDEGRYVSLGDVSGELFQRVELLSREDVAANAAQQCCHRQGRVRVDPPISSRTFELLEDGV